MNGYPPVAYANLRQVVDPALAGLPPWELRARIDSEFGDGAAEAMEADLESFWSDMGHTLAKAAPAITTVAGGALQGAMAGSSAGLPGIIAGAAVGGAGAGLSKYGSGTAKNIGQTLTGVTNMASQLTPMGQAGAALGGTVSGLGSAMGQKGGAQAALGAAVPHLIQGVAQAAGAPRSPGVQQGLGALTNILGGSRATDQLASLLQRPEFQQALAAMRLGELGRNSVPVGPAQTQVPTGAFMQLLSHLTTEATSEVAAEAGADSDSEALDLAFMRDPSGQYSGDPSSVRERAARLWSLLNDAQSERLAEAVAAEWGDSPESGNESESDSQFEAEWDGYDSDQEFLDSLELQEVEAIESALADQEMSDAW